MFDPRALPAMGVGVEYHSYIDAPRIGPLNLPGFIDYVEIQPPHVIFDPGLFDALGDTRPMLHSSDLSLGSIGIPMDPEFLELTCRLLRRTATPWFSEHMSWNRFPGGDTRHFVLPFLGDEVRDAIIANARELQRRSGLPVLLENAPRSFILDLPGDSDESRFLRSIVTGADAGFILDIDNARVTAATRGESLGAYLDGLPLDRTVEIHVHDPIGDRDLYWDVLKSAPVKAVTIGWSTRKRGGDPELIEAVAALKAQLDEPPPPKAYPSALSERSIDRPHRIAPDVALIVRDGRVKVTGGAHSLMLELAPETLPIAMHFATPQPLASVLDLPIFANIASIAQAAATVRDLLALGVLADAAQPHRDHEVWAEWDSAFDFYLATRTGADTPFASLAETNETLVAKAQTQPPPSAYKDYDAHPFFALPNPLGAHTAPESPAGFLDVLLRRRSLRAFAETPLSADHLSQLLYYGWGATGAVANPLGDPFLRKTSPGAGSLHGAEVYPILMNVDGYDGGVYHYSVRRHGLELLSREDPRAWINAACGDQPWIGQCAAVFLTTSVVKRLGWKYAYSRGFRAALLDVGHLGQSFALTATWLGLAPFTTAALRDALFEDKVGLDYRVEPVLMVNGVGHPAEAMLIPDRPS